MKKLLMIILILFSIVLTSCMGTNGLEQYVGEYVIEANYNRTYHYYFGSTKKVNEANLIGRSFTFEIKDDATIEVTYDNGEKEIGKVSCTEEKIKFRKINLLKDYEYEYSKKGNDVYLSYTKSENKIGFEYDYKSEGIVFKKKYKAIEKDEQTYTCFWAYLSQTAYYPTYKNGFPADKNFNKLMDSKLSLNMIDKTFTITTTNASQSGTFEINEKKYIFHINEEKPLIPSDKEFTYDDYEEHYRYLTIKYKITEDKEGYRLESEYEISFSMIV